MFCPEVPQLQKLVFLLPVFTGRNRAIVENGVVGTSTGLSWYACYTFPSC
jgi:hypothetical protein